MIATGNKYKDETFYNDAFKRSLRYYYPWYDSPYYDMWQVMVDRTLSPYIELGCGSGQFAEYAENKGTYYVVGFDYSKDAIDIARCRNPGMLFVCEDIMKLRYEDLLADYIPKTTIVAFEVLEHLEDDIELLRRIGLNKIVFSVPGFDAPAHLRYFENLQDVRNHYSQIVDITDIKEFGEGDYKYWLVWSKGREVTCK